MKKPSLHQLSPIKDRGLHLLESAGLSAWVLLLFVVIGLIPLVFRGAYAVRLATSCLLLGIQAVAFDFTSGFINVINFGFAALVGLGAYTSGVLAVRYGVSPWVGMLAAAVVSGGVGLFVGVLTLRLRGIFAAVMAWFVGLALMELATVWVGVTRGQLGLRVPFLLDTAARRPYFYTLLPIAIGIYVTLAAVQKSRAGLAFRALGQNLDVARARGINPTKYRVLNFTVSCAAGGLLGGFYAHYVGILTPSIMETSNTIEILVLSYIGGRGSLWGGLVTAFAIIPVFEYLKPMMQVRLVLYGLFLILVTIAFPGGIATGIRSLGARLSRVLQSSDARSERS